MTLNVKGLNSPIKGRDCQIGLNKIRPNYVLSSGDILQIQRL